MSIVHSPSSPEHARAGSGPTDRERPDAPGLRWSRVGHGAAADARGAVASAIGQLGLVDRSEQPSLLMVFCSPEFEGDDILAAVADLAPGIATIGCTAAGEVSNRGLLDGSVVIMALGGAGLRCSTAVMPIVDGDARTATAAAARCADELERLGSTVLIILADGQGIDQDDLIRGAYDTVGPTVPLVGGCACGRVLQDDTTIFHLPAGGGREAGTAGAGNVVVAAISSDGPIGVGVGHGFEAVGEPLVVTSSGRNVVATLQEMPALDAYLRHHGATEAIFDDPQAFAELAQARPLGVARRGRVEPRAVIGADRDGRTLLTGAPVPQGGMVWLLEGDTQSALAAVDGAVDEAFAALDGAPAIATVVFDCGARRSMLGLDGVTVEIERITARADCPVAGLYTFGEIARTSGSSGFHNLTAVILAFG